MISFPSSINVDFKEILPNGEAYYLTEKLLIDDLSNFIPSYVSIFPNVRVLLLVDVPILFNILS